MAEFLQVLGQQWASQSMAEVVAVVLAIAYVLLAAKESIWCWPCAFISTGLYTWLFWEVSLPFQSALNAYYLLMAVYGWYKWRKQIEEKVLPVSSWLMQKHVKVILGLTACSAVLIFAAGHVLNSDYLVLDAAITVFSVFVTWMMANKILQNWLYWIVINSAAAWLYWQQELVLTSVLFVGYVFFAVYGYFSWSKSQQQALA